MMTTPKRACPTAWLRFVRVRVPRAEDTTDMVLAIMWLSLDYVTPTRVEATRSYGRQQPQNHAFHNDSGPRATTRRRLAPFLKAGDFTPDVLASSV